MFKYKFLQNAPRNKVPTIVISQKDKSWELAYEEWLNGKNPTNSLEWKLGVFMLNTETHPFPNAKSELKEVY